MLHCGNEFLKQVPDFCFKLNDIVPRYGSTIKSSFLGTVGITFLGTWSLFIKGFYGLLYNCWWVADLFYDFSLIFNFQMK